MRSEPVWLAIQDLQTISSFLAAESGEGLGVRSAASGCCLYDMQLDI